MQDGRSLALDELKQDTLDLEANGVIGVAFTVTNIEQGGGMTLVSATGTAARLVVRG